MSLIKTLLQKMSQIKASDLHVRVGRPPVFRVYSRLISAKMDKLSVAQVDEILHEILSDDQLNLYNTSKEVDLSIGYKGVGRFRVNVYSQRNTVAIAFRRIMSIIPDFEDLHLPEVVRDIALKERGIILITGTTGSGKSTSLASMIEFINAKISKNIITIEDPIEYLYTDKKSLISQREVGVDTNSYKTALKQALRQDPDTILIGEIRDAETMLLALQAADTGHLVMSTLHTLNASETISRIISFFPPHQHQQIRLLLSNTLVSVISQRLLPRKDGSGVLPAVEVMINTQTIREYLMNPEKTALIDVAISEGRKQYKSQSFDQHILDMYQSDLIEFEIAKANVNNPEDFELKLRGIESTSGRSW